MRERQNPSTICRHARTIPEMPNMRALSHTYTFSISSQIDFGYPAMTDLGISGNERAPKPRALLYAPIFLDSRKTALTARTILNRERRSRT